MAVSLQLCHDYHGCLCVSVMLQTYSTAMLDEMIWWLWCFLSVGLYSVCGGMDRLCYETFWGTYIGHWGHLTCLYLCHMPCMTLNVDLESNMSDTTISSWSVCIHCDLVIQHAILLCFRRRKSVLYSVTSSSTCCQIVHSRSTIPTSCQFSPRSWIIYTTFHYSSPWLVTLTTILLSSHDQLICYIHVLTF